MIRQLSQTNFSVFFLKLKPGYGGHDTCRNPVCRNTGLSHNSVLKNGAFFIWLIPNLTWLQNIIQDSFIFYICNNFLLILAMS